jgi:hypothetical protein
MANTRISGRPSERPSGEASASELPRIKDIAISETGFVFDPFSGGTFTLNATGQSVIKGLRNGLSREQLVEHLQGEFSGASNRVAQDLDDFLRALREFGLVSDPE